MYNIINNEKYRSQYFKATDKSVGVWCAGWSDRAGDGAAGTRQHQRDEGATAADAALLLLPTLHEPGQTRLIISMKYLYFLGQIL